MTTNYPISVILIVKNGERYLNQSIDSILKQDIPLQEILVIDGHSTDSTSAIAESYPQVTWRLQSGVGVSDAYNQGIRSARGDYIAFISHDDIWEPDKLRLQFRMFDDPSLDYCITWFDYFLAPGELPPPGFRREWLNSHHVGKIMETLMVRKRVFDRVGGFDPSLSTAEDADWYARAQDAGLEYRVLEKVLVHKRIHERNVSINTRENNANLLRALKRSIDRKKDSHP